MSNEQGSLNSQIIGNHDKKIFRPFLGYVLNFVGAGMVSGGVVHYPLNENFYGILTVAGSIVFTIGALVTEIVNGRKLGNFRRIFFLVTTSLLLSFGIGMLSGGIQHFTDFPDRATILIPAGLILSFVAFVLKFEKLRKGLFGKVALGGTFIALIAGVSFLGLGQLASSLQPAGHTHGENGDTSSDTPDTHDHSTHDH